jgi:hypothetical protein
MHTAAAMMGRETTVPLYNIKHNYNTTVLLHIIIKLKNAVPVVPSIRGCLFHLNDVGLKRSNVRLAGRFTERALNVH